MGGGGGGGGGLNPPVNPPMSIRSVYHCSESNAFAKSKYLTSERIFVLRDSAKLSQKSTS